MSKSIRARSDIISCQVAYLLKEVADVSDNISKGSTTNAGPKLKNQGEPNHSYNFFANGDDKIITPEQSLLSAIEKDPDGKLPEEIMSARLLWIEELTKSLSPSKMREILLPFLKKRGLDGNHRKITHAGTNLYYTDAKYNKPLFINNGSLTKSQLRLMGILSQRQHTIKTKHVKILSRNCPCQQNPSRNYGLWGF